MGAIRLRGAIAAELELDRFLILAENSVHDDLFRRVVEQLDDAGVTPVALKGIALLHGVYDDLAARTMNDIDVWIPAEQVATALDALRPMGFLRNGEKAARPDDLQALSHGEIQLLSAEYPRNLIELQRSPFAGWWMLRAANIDHVRLFSETVAAPDGNARQLSPEDNILHFATHTVITHQVSLYALRAFVDTRSLSEARLDWQKLTARARRWRLAPILWLHLWLTEQTVGLPDGRDAIAALRPPRWQRWLIERFVSADDALTKVELDQGIRRFLFLLTLTDRKRDALNLVLRSVWPETAWLTARYGAPRRWHHLWQLVRHRRL